jgi:serine/threonine-protein kinase HipA
MTAILDVYLGDSLAGRLRREESSFPLAKEKLRFSYTNKWLASKRFIPLSVTLPRRAREFDDDLVRPFFANLLPEADMREAIAKKRGESAHDIFGLLEEFGGDCAGAVSLWPIGQRAITCAGYESLSSQRLKQNIDKGKKAPLLLIADAIRMSIAGSHDKLPLCYKRGRFSLPQGLASSSHILKPPSEKHPHLPLNEFFCMTFAQHLGLKVCASRLLRSPDVLLIVERYDRINGAGGSLNRLHQIDFCQASNVMPEDKYEKDGGPDLKACFNLLARHSADVGRDKRRLMSWVICNYIIGNADTHAKQLSLMLMPGSTRLSPFYDLVCTSMYSDYPDELVLRIGGEKDPRKLTRRHWQRLTRDARMAEHLTEQLLARILRKTPTALAEAKARIRPLDAAEQKLLRNIEATIQQRAAHLAHTAA